MWAVFCTGIGRASQGPATWVFTKLLGSGSAAGHDMSCPNNGNTLETIDIYRCPSNPRAISIGFLRNPVQGHGMPCPAVDPSTNTVIIMHGPNL